MDEDGAGWANKKVDLDSTKIRNNNEYNTRLSEFCFLFSDLKEFVPLLKLEDKLNIVEFLMNNLNC